MNLVFGFDFECGFDIGSLFKVLCFIFLLILNLCFALFLFWIGFQFVNWFLAFMLVSFYSFV